MFKPIDLKNESSVQRIAIPNKARINPGITHINELAGIFNRNHCIRLTGNTLMSKGLVAESTAVQILTGLKGHLPIQIELTSDPNERNKLKTLLNKVESALERITLKRNEIYLGHAILTFDEISLIIDCLNLFDFPGILKGSIRLPLENEISQILFKGIISDSVGQYVGDPACGNLVHYIELAPVPLVHINDRKGLTELRLNSLMSNACALNIGFSLVFEEVPEDLSELR